MKQVSRRSCLAFLGIGGLTAPFAHGADSLAKRRQLPMSTIFKGESRFQAIARKGVRENWGKLPIGERMILCADELHGLPYQNFTLEIDDHIESPSVNFNGLDCWTFFETCLGMSRMLAYPKNSFQPGDLLREIQFTRYRGGQCSGNYLERIHYLAEWYYDNDAKGACRHITRDLGHAQRIQGRKISEMTTLWKSYRYLRNNPSLRGPMKNWENHVQQMPVYYIPKSKVSSIESKLQNGDVIGIATKYNGGFCSHVGLIKRSKGVSRFMHASRTYKKVVIDKSISGYLYDFDKHAGIIVGRPLEVNQTVTDFKQYQANLKQLIG